MASSLSIGSPVLYTARRDAGIETDFAFVVKILPDGRVNLACFSSDGLAYAAQGVELSAEKAGSEGTEGKACAVSAPPRLPAQPPFKAPPPAGSDA